MSNQVDIAELRRLWHKSEDPSVVGLDWANTRHAMHDQFLALLDELEAAREDSSRLDFLAKSSRLTPTQVSGIVNGFRYKRVKYADIRAATDAAMEDS